MKLDIKYGEKIDIESNRENNIIHYDQVKAETFLDKKDLPPLDSFNFNNNSYANQLWLLVPAQNYDAIHAM